MPIGTTMDTSQTPKSRAPLAVTTSAIAVLFLLAMFGMEYWIPSGHRPHNAVHALYFALMVVGGNGVILLILSLLHKKWGGETPRPVSGRLHLGSTWDSVVYFSAGLTSLSLRVVEGVTVSFGYEGWLAHSIQLLFLWPILKPLTMEINLASCLKDKPRTHILTGMGRCLLLMLAGAPGAAAMAINLAGVTPISVAITLAGIFIGVLGVGAVAEWFAREVEACPGGAVKPKE